MNKIICTKCKKPLIRVHKQGGIVICNSCNEPVVESGYNSETKKMERALRCPNSTCGFYPIMNPEYNTRCPKCDQPVLNSNPKNFK